MWLFKSNKESKKENKVDENDNFITEDNQ